MMLGEPLNATVSGGELLAASRLPVGKLERRHDQLKIGCTATQDADRPALGARPARDIRAAALSKWFELRLNCE